MGEELNPLVEWHSGSEYAERPLALRWEGQRLEICAVVARWRTPTGRHFRVRVVDKREFDLFYDENSLTTQVAEIVKN